MSDPAYAMQQAIVTALKASSPLATAMGGTATIYDQVAADPVYPFIRVGEDQSLDDSNGCSDGWEFLATFHIFARQIEGLGARPLAKRIGAALVTAAKGVGAATGFVIADQNLESTRYYMEDDGITAHGVVVIRYLIDAA